MKKDAIAISYARALMELAAERDEIDTVLEEVEFVLRLMQEDASFRIFIESPGIDAAKKKTSLDTIFEGRLSSTLLDFLQVVVVKKGRALLLAAALEEYRELYDVRMNRVHVEAVTATPLADDRREKITESLAASLDKTVLLENTVSPDLLGGLILRYGDLVIDGSVRSRLRRLASRVDATQLGSELIHED